MNNVSVTNFVRPSRAFERQAGIPITYKGARIGEGFPADVVVGHQVILEVKAVAAILPAHEAQLRTGSKLARS